MKSSNTVSIVVPVYNAEKFLATTIESFINQTYKEIEIILVNDGSTDSSQQIIDEYVEKDSRIKSITTENMGAPHARNTGLDAATGEYVVFFDADDVMHTDEISLLLDGLGEDIDLVIGSRDKITEDGKLFQTDKLKDGVFDPRTDDINYLINISPFPNNKLYSRTVLIKNGIYFHNVKIAQDANLYLKYLSVCRKVRTLSKPVCLYRVVENSISRTYNKKVIDIIRCEEDISRFAHDQRATEKYLFAMKSAFVKYCLGQIMKIGLMKDKQDRLEVLNTVGMYTMHLFDGESKPNDHTIQKLQKIDGMMKKKSWYTSSIYYYCRHIEVFARRLAVGIVSNVKK